MLAESYQEDIDVVMMRIWPEALNNHLKKQTKTKKQMKISSKELLQVTNALITTNVSTLE